MTIAAMIFFIIQPLFYTQQNYRLIFMACNLFRSEEEGYALSPPHALIAAISHGGFCPFMYNQYPLVGCINEL